MFQLLRRSRVQAYILIQKEQLLAIISNYLLQTIVNAFTIPVVFVEMLTTSNWFAVCGHVAFISIAHITSNLLNLFISLCMIFVLLRQLDVIKQGSESQNIFFNTAYKEDCLNGKLNLCWTLWRKSYPKLHNTVSVWTENTLILLFHWAFKIWDLVAPVSGQLKSNCLDD